jgi:hypothetical protein
LNIRALLVEHQELLRLDLGVLERLIQERFGGETGALMKGWPVAPSPGRTTIWRWLNGKKFPRNVDELFGLAGALDVDPLGLLGLSGQITWSELCQATREYHWNFRLAPRVARFWFLQNLIGPNSDWPSSTIAQRYFKRTWERRTHLHRASEKRNHYGRFLLELEEAVPDQVWHFAWRSHADKPWRPYGFIRREGPNVHLCAFEGLEAIAKLAGNTAFLVETWFGKGDAEFCIASLHKFGSTVGPPSSSAEQPTVRFRKSPVQP